MEIDEKEKTAPGSSVGADEGQPIQKEDNNSISNSDPKSMIQPQKQKKVCVINAGKCKACLIRTVFIPFL